jgi:hypothetical protein
MTDITNQEPAEETEAAATALQAQLAAATPAAETPTDVVEQPEPVTPAPTAPAAPTTLEERVEASVTAWYDTHIRNSVLSQYTAALHNLQVVLQHLKTDLVAEFSKSPEPAPAPTEQKE